MPSWVATIQEKQNSMQNMGLWIFYIVSPILFFFHPCFAQPRIPTKVSSFHSYVCASHQTSGKVPQRSLAYALLYMLLILQLKPPLCVINPQHQPLIDPNSSKNTKLAMTQSLAQWKSNSNYRFLQAPPSTQTATISTTKTNLSFFALKLHFLYLSNNILPLVSI